MSKASLLLAVALVVLILVLVGARRRPRKGLLVDRHDPIWVAAMEKARATVPVLRELFQSGLGPIGVKYPLPNTAGESEHVWGELQALEQDYFVATLATPMRRGRPASSPPYTMPLSTLEDWQLILEDGTVRGGFTTQADIETAIASGQSIPDHVRERQGRFVDR